MNKSLFYKVSLLVLITFSSLNAQTFGFGCLGLSGFYGGYGEHSYKADGLNESLVLRYNSIPEFGNDFKFEKATGFRFGINVLRANFGSLFITAKGFYQFSKEKHTADYTLSNASTSLDFQLTTNHWGVGIDFGFPLFSLVDLKIIEGGLSFYQVKYKESMQVDGGEISEEEYKNDGPDIGYYVGSGLILNLIEGYISIEGTAMYTFLSIDQLSAANGSIYPLNSVDKKLITEGGFSAVLQLNIGFPL